MRTWSITFSITVPFRIPWKRATCATGDLVGAMIPIGTTVPTRTKLVIICAKIMYVEIVRDHKFAIKFLELLA